jgi:ubiquinone/menaquinone biosynthesis C-methylase UbiE
MPKDAYRLSLSARTYDLWAEPAVRALRKILLEVYPPRENISILDAECGTGTQLGLYSKPGCKLYGVDSSPTFLDAARRKLGDSAELSVQDASHMSFPDRMFDLITMIITLHEIPASLRLAVLTECKRVLKADGRILVADFHFGPYSSPEGRMDSTLRLFGEMSLGRDHFSNFRDYRKRGCLAPLIAESKLSIEKQLVPPTGVVEIYLLRLQ